MSEAIQALERSDAGAVKRLLEHAGLPFVVLDVSGNIIESRLDAVCSSEAHVHDAETQICDLVKSGDAPEPGSIVVADQAVPVEIIRISEDTLVVSLLAGDQLRQTRLNRSIAMETLAGKLIHFYNNILTEFYGHVSLLTRIYPDPDLNQRLDRIVDTVNRTRHLIERYMFMLREVKEPKATVNIIDVLNDLKTVLEPLFNPRIELILDDSTTTPTTVCAEHQHLMQLLVSLNVALVKDGFVSERVVIELQTRGNMLALCFVTDVSNNPDNSIDTLEYVDRSLKSFGGSIEIERGDETTTFVSLLPKFLNDEKPDAKAGGQSSARKGNKSIVLLIDTLSRRSDQSKAVLEAMGFSVLDIAEGVIAHEVFQAQPDIFEFVFIDARFASVAEEMKTMTDPMSVQVFGDGMAAWPESEDDWQTYLNWTT